MAFLDDFMAQLTLTSTDRAILNSKRGLSDETIDLFGFKSCGKYIKQVIADNCFSQNEMRDNGIVDDNGNIARQLLRNNIIIPYKNKFGEIDSIRPHKDGLSGVQLEMFSDQIFDRASPYVIITEGEFKAIAGFQLGLNMICIPGINTFSKTRYPDLLAFLSESSVKKIYFLFDSEDKGNPQFENFKPDWKNRYDVEMYSYAMAKKLARDRYDTYICEFPPEWRVNGKADVDSVLAMGKGTEDFQQILNAGLHHDEFLKAVLKRVERQHALYIQKRVRNLGKDQPIIRWNNCYWLAPKEGSDARVGPKLSNFVINISATYCDNTTDSLKREIVITNEDGDKTKPKVIDANSMSSVHQFKTFGYSQGNYMFYGNDQQLMQIWEWEFSCDSGRMIYEMDHVGKLEGAEDLGYPDMWITKDKLFFGDRIQRADENGVFWIGESGIRVSSLDAESSASNNTPSVCQMPNLAEEPIDFNEMVDHFKGIAGEGGKLLIGWAAFSLVRSYLKQFSNITPYPFLHGEKQTGKTTICQCVMALFGLPDFGTTFTDITKVAITRLMSYYSGFPLWIDEFSNEQRIQSYEPHLKSVYNRMPVIKGVRQAFGVATYPIRSGLLLSGETMPVMDAVKQRSVFMGVRLRIHNAKSLQWIEDNKKSLGYFTFHILKHRHTMAEECDIHIKKFYDAISTTIPSIDLRTAKHYALFAGCYRAFTGVADEGFNNWLLQCIAQQINIVQKDEVGQFFEDMAVLFADNRINQEFFCYGEYEGRKCIFVWYAGVYDKWKESYSKFKEIHGRESLLNAIKLRDYFVAVERVRIRKQQHRALIVDLEKAPEELRDMLESTMSTLDLSITRLKSFE